MYITPFLRMGNKLGGGTWKVKKGWKYGVGAGFHKRGREAVTFPVQFFKVYHFYLKKLLYPLQSYVMHLKKKNIFLLP